MSENRGAGTTFMHCEAESRKTMCSFLEYMEMGPQLDEDTGMVDRSKDAKS